MLENNPDVVPLFMLPAELSGLLLCLLIFLAIVFGIVVLEKFWIKKLHHEDKREKSLYRILLWEFGSVVALIIVYVAGLYCVVLPLLFLVALLSMWYLVDSIHRI